MEKQNNRYSVEFKIKAVELSNERGSIIAIARELNVNRDVLRRWKSEYAAGKYTTVGVKTKSNEELEIVRLKKALYEATLERDILKKAVSIFSKSDR